MLGRRQRFAPSALFTPVQDTVHRVGGSLEQSKSHTMSTKALCTRTGIRLAVGLEAVGPVLVLDAATVAADIDAGIAILQDPATFEPSFVWYTAWGRRR
jgi:hypothetical protein